MSLEQLISDVEKASIAAIRPRVEELMDMSTREIEPLYLKLCAPKASRADMIAAIAVQWQTDEMRRRLRAIPVDT